jgi:hypothetical protein
MNTNEHQYRMTRWRALRMAGGFVVQGGQLALSPTRSRQAACMRQALWMVNAALRLPSFCAKPPADLCSFVSIRG